GGSSALPRDAGRSDGDKERKDGIWSISRQGRFGHASAMVRASTGTARVVGARISRPADGPVATR
ncbi:MAG: hypothetical protein QOI79_3829, partial [Mycobacterium sp.]|nr:hypothetical protein [Mycobacterium sp.]